MTQMELTTDFLRRNLEMLKMTLADFSDADLLVRPCPGANHAAWQLGHLATSEAAMLNAVRPGSVPPAPKEFLERYSAGTTSVDDPKAFLPKEQVLAQLAKTRQTLIETAKSLTAKDLEQPTPERMHSFAPTLGQLLLMIPIHVTMHLGQMQVIRRKLGKPVLY